VEEHHAGDDAGRGRAADKDLGVTESACHARVLRAVSLPAQLPRLVDDLNMTLDSVA
jgi:hypothetical protein